MLRKAPRPKKLFHTPNPFSIDQLKNNINLVEISAEKFQKLFKGH